jgi:hypothetical protein
MRELEQRMAESPDEEYLDVPTGPQGDRKLWRSPRTRGKAG